MCDVIEAVAFRYVQMKFGYELFRGHHGLIRPNWMIKFRGERIGFASSERAARAIVKEHMAERSANGFANI